jgi:hypothetical protein
VYWNEEEKEAGERRSEEDLGYFSIHFATYIPKFRNVIVQSWRRLVYILEEREGMKGSQDIWPNE